MRGVGEWGRQFGIAVETLIMCELLYYLGNLTCDLFIYLILAYFDVHTGFPKYFSTIKLCSQKITRFILYQLDEYF